MKAILNNAFIKLLTNANGVCLKQHLLQVIGNTISFCINNNGLANRYTHRYIDRYCKISSHLFPEFFP